MMRARRVMTVLLGTVSLVALQRSARAEGFYWGVRYNASVPVGSVRSFVPDIAPVGFDLDARYWFANNLSVGVDGAWNRFSDKLDFGTYPITNGTLIANGAVTGAIYRYVELAAILPEVHYYFYSPNRSIVPFVGLAAGFSMVWFKVLVSDIEVSEKKPGFMLAPEVGILVPFDRVPDVLRQSLTLGVRYAFSTSGFADVANTSFIALQLGALVY